MNFRIAIKNVFPYVFVICCLFACKKEEDSSSNTANNTNNNGGDNSTDPGSVYVCGDINNGSFTDWYPRYWKDGVEQIVGDGRRGHAYDIWATDNHVFIAGNVFDGGLTIPCYWSNNELIELNTYACGDCSAEDLFVVGDTDVHLAGHVRVESQFSTIQKAMYWNNGIATELTNGADDARAFGVFVYNNDVFVCGYEADGPGGRKLAKYWLNGEEVVLGDGEDNSEARAIWVSNGTVYVVGYEDIDLLGLGEVVSYPVIWTNGVRNVLSSVKGEAEGIFVDNNVVHVVGFTEPFAGSSITIGCYWVNDNYNGIYNSIAPTNGSHGWGIFSKNNEVHTVQSYYGPSGQTGHYAKHPGAVEQFFGDVTWGIHIN